MIWPYIAATGLTALLMGVAGGITAILLVFWDWLARPRPPRLGSISKAWLNEH